MKLIIIEKHYIGRISWGQYDERNFNEAEANKKVISRALNSHCLNGW